MAKNIFTTLEDRILDVDHKTFGERSMDLPGWFPTDTTFENEEELLTWCKEEGILLATLQAGYQKHLIDCRAKVRPASKKGVDQPWDGLEKDRLGTFKPSAMKRPGQGIAKATNKAVEEAKADLRRKMIKTLQEQGMSEEMIKAVVSAL